MRTTMMAGYYYKAGATIISHKKLVFVELFKGTGSMSHIADMMSHFSHIYTLDVNPECHADFTCDIREPIELETVLQKLLSDGFIIFMHASPPCNAFSRMNTNQKKTSNTPVKNTFENALDIVKQTVNIMNKYSVLWVLENPATGSMWETDYAKETFKFVHKVDYCAYGSIIQKETKFAFSREDVFTLFQPKECEGRTKCVACFRDPSSGYLGHMDWEKVKYKKRISIPDQLCVSIISSLLSPIKTVAIELQTELSKLRTKSVSQKQSQTSLQIISPKNIHIIEQHHKKRRKTHNIDCELNTDIKWDIIQSDIVVFASKNPYFKTSNLNITSTEYIANSQFCAMAIYVTQNSPQPSQSIIIDGQEYYVIKGRRYIGTFDDMSLSNIEDIFIIHNIHILTVYTLSEHDDYLTFKITKAKKKHILNMLQKIDDITNINTIS